MFIYLTASYIYIMKCVIFYDSFVSPIPLLMEYILRPLQISCLLVSGPLSYKVWVNFLGIDGSIFLFIWLKEMSLSAENTRVKELNSFLVLLGIRGNLAWIWMWKHRNLFIDVEEGKTWQTLGTCWDEDRKPLVKDPRNSVILIIQYC